jgi:hypothetical protein
MSDHHVSTASRGAAVEAAAGKARMSKPSVIVEAIAMPPEPMAAAMESSEEAGVVDEEIDGVGIVPRAEKRVVVGIVRLGVGAIRVGVRVAVVGAVVGVAVVGVVAI